MKCGTNPPKTFLIYARNRKSGGYIRFKGFASEPGKIDFRVALVKRMPDASRFVGGENTRLKARGIKAKYGFERVEIIDEISKRRTVI